MKKTLIALAALAATSVFAQSSVTISGQVDAGIVNPIGPQKARIDQSGNGSNQIVFGGAEDLGGGMKANFRLALRFTPESGLYDGSNSNRAPFQGESTLGLSGGFGSLKIGRALTALQGPINNTDPWGTYQQASVSTLVRGYNTDIDNLSTLDGAAASGGGAARTDGIWYTTPSFGGFSASGTFGFKQSQSSGTVVTTNPKSFTSLWLAYAGGPIYVGAGAEQNRVGDRVAAILATYDLGMVKLGAGFSKLDAETVGSISSGIDRKSWNVSATAPLGAFLLKAGYAQSKRDDTGVKDFKKAGLGVDYALSKRTIVYTSVGHDRARTSDKNGFDLGIRHSF
jgi:predicted porin